jgi:hypothetical protein
MVTYNNIVNHDTAEDTPKRNIHSQVLMQVTNIQHLFSNAAGFPQDLAKDQPLVLRTLALFQGWHSCAAK